MKKRVAVIGTGISGLTLSYLLNKDTRFKQGSELVVFEAEDRIGGHTATIDVEHDGRHYSIDTGFIVFNDWTYPNFIKLMNDLDVDSQPTDMGFSLSCAETGLEYSGKNLTTLFTQKRNLLNPGHWTMLRDILRFNKQALVDVEDDNIDSNMRLGDYLSNPCRAKRGQAKKGYGQRFKDFYLAPMASAIWSSSLADVENMPLQFFVRFFKNHGLLSVNDRPQWRVISGGSRSYIEPLTRDFSTRIRTSCPVRAIRRGADGVYIDSCAFEDEHFDEVVFACHSDQALDLLVDVSEQEQNILGALPYSQNEVVLHTDETLLPNAKKAWSSWNYLLGRNKDKAVLTYNMNILQGINSETTFCVTMNDTSSIDPDKIIGRYQYAHPEFSQQGIEAQARWREINGVNRTWFCGAWWGNGFHEDGVTSAIRVADAMLTDVQEASAA